MEIKMQQVNGIAYWASVQKVNTTFDPMWCVDLFVDDETAAMLKGLGLTPKKVRTNKKGLITHKGYEEGDEFFQFKRKEYRRDGTKNKPPKVVDSKNAPIPDLIGNGSEVNVAFNTYKWQHSGREGVSADLAGVQVLKLETFEMEAEFAATDGYVGTTPAESGPTDDDPFAS